jgi:hypothetical protein
VVEKPKAKVEKNFLACKFQISSLGVLLGERREDET